jgi:hypothetical protein
MGAFFYYIANGIVRNSYRFAPAPLFAKSSPTNKHKNPFFCIVVFNQRPLLQINIY